MFVSWFQRWFVYLVICSVMWFCVNLFVAVKVSSFLPTVILVSVGSVVEEYFDISFGYYIHMAANKACTRLLLVVRKIQSLVSVRKSG